MKNIKILCKTLCRYLFHKHKWQFFEKWYKGNEKIGHVESEYTFRCRVCGKHKTIKIR